MALVYLTAALAAAFAAGMYTAFRIISTRTARDAQVVALQEHLTGALASIRLLRRQIAHLRSERDALADELRAARKDNP